MLNLNFNPFPVLTTERLVLRNVERSDVKEMFFQRSDESVMKYIDRERAKTEAEALAFIEMLLGLVEKNESITWAITLKGNDKLLGTICYWNIQKENDRAEVGYALHPEVQGKGIMQEALTCILDYGFTILNLHSVEANVNPGNEASIRLLERNNFVREGYFKENYYYNGKFLDSAIYSLLVQHHRKN